MKSTGENRQLGEKPVPVPLCPPQISHGHMQSLGRLVYNYLLDQRVRMKRPISSRFAPGKKPRYPLYRRPGGFQRRSGRVYERETLLPTPGFEPRTVQLQGVALPTTHSWPLIIN
jgi:hypothetical protein